MRSTADPSPWVEDVTVAGEQHERYRSITVRPGARSRYEICKLNRCAGEVLTFQLSRPLVMARQATASAVDFPRLLSDCRSE